MIAQPIELATYYGWPCSQTCSARITPASMGDGDPYWGMDPLAAGEGPAYLFRVRMCSESRSTIVDLLRFELYGRCLCSASPSTPLRLELYGRFLCSDSARTPVRLPACMPSCVPVCLPACLCDCLPTCLLTCCMPTPFHASYHPLYQLPHIDRVTKYYTSHKLRLPPTVQAKERYT